MNSLYKTNLRRQKGYLLPLALFVIVILSVSAVIMLKQINRNALVYVSAEFANLAIANAEVGGQLARYQLLIPNADRQQIDSRCASLSIQPVFDLPGMRECRLYATCECRYETDQLCDPSDASYYEDTSTIEHSFYFVNVSSQCGTGFYSAHDNVNLIISSP